MTWIKDNGRWAILNAVALVIITNLLSQAIPVSAFPAKIAGIEPLVESGKWAVRFLLFSLLMTPLNTLFGWRSAIPLRKPAGLWAFGFGLAHFAFYVTDTSSLWLQYPIPDYMAGLGVFGLVILTALAATSTRWAMKRLGKGWKRLHRLVYLAGSLVLLHALLEASSSKRVLVADPQAAYEVRLYLVILVLLLLARLPALRTHLAKLRFRRGITV
jgi:sulfoxide reductase heme-binding subunit YedZ